MNILIFGANGKTEQVLLKQALEQGHTVTAFVRNATQKENRAFMHS
jgi:putative NADH-flavin reductase